jgi:hypothetical protein
MWVRTSRARSAASGGEWDQDRQKPRPPPFVQRNAPVMWFSVHRAPNPSQTWGSPDPTGEPPTRRPAEPPPPGPTRPRPGRPAAARACPAPAPTAAAHRAPPTRGASVSSTGLRLRRPAGPSAADLTTEAPPPPDGPDPPPPAGPTGPPPTTSPRIQSPATPERPGCCRVSPGTPAPQAPPKPPGR